jgi:thymidine kinase
MFSGKCYGEGVMFPFISDNHDADYVAVQDIKIGYHLVGHDGTLRKVINTCTGEDDMYEIQYDGDKHITVTQDHVLCLVGPNNSYVDVPLNIYLKHPDEYSQHTMYKLTGDLSEPVNVKFTCRPLARGMYYGFTVLPIADRPERVIIDDGLVVHNTIQLLNRLERHYRAKRNCVVIQHAFDKRYEHLVKSGGLVCNNGTENTTIPVIRTDLLGSVDVSGYDVIGVNEAQFYPDLLIVDDWARNGKIVIVDGLDGDTARDNFGQIYKLMPKCEQITKLSAVCTFCGKDAPFTVKIGNSQHTVQYVSGTNIAPIKVDIGDSSVYTPVCRQCYYKHQTGDDKK